jgi:hypothetical protein
LTDSGADFSSLNPRDIVHNVTKKSDGLITALLSGTAVKAALFGGTGQSWASGDSYVIQPATHKTLYLDAPSENADDTISVPYKRMPGPVFSDYGTWQFSAISGYGIVCGAVFRFMSAKRGLKAKETHRREFMREVRQKRAEVALSILQGQRYSTRS